MQLALDRADATVVSQALNVEARAEAGLPRPRRARVYEERAWITETVPPGLGDGSTVPYATGGGFGKIMEVAG